MSKTSLKKFETNIPELEHVVGVDAELGYFLLVGGEGDEVEGDKIHVALMRQEPFLGRLRVRHRLLRCERLLWTISKLVGFETEVVLKL